MTTANRAEAQQRSDDIRVFNIELQRLERNGVLELHVVWRSAINQRLKPLEKGFYEILDRLQMALSWKHTLFITDARPA